MTTYHIKLGFTPVCWLHFGVVSYTFFVYSAHTSRATSGSGP